jgi:hypothetical protein
VPIRVTARDDLAIRRIALAWSRSGQTEKADAEHELYAGPASLPSQAGGLAAVAALGDQRVVTHAWNLAPLGLKPGEQLAFWATAADYRPQTGKSPLRRLTVVTAEEMTQRIAARQALVLAELARALALQRQVRQQVAASDALLQGKRRPDPSDVGSLANAERAQRHVRDLLTSRVDGVPMQALGVLADLEDNKLDSPDIKRWMRTLLARLDQLNRDELPAVGVELTAAIKTAETQLEIPVAQPPLAATGDNDP